MPTHPHTHTDNFFTFVFLYWLLGVMKPIPRDESNKQLKIKFSPQKQFLTSSKIKEWNEAIQIRHLKQYNISHT